LIESSEDGTLFLDEIETLSTEIQVKLLRVLENREFFRLGSSKQIRANSKFIFGTNIDPEELVVKGKMREDFYFRIDSAVKIDLPDLLDRESDITEIFRFFLQKVMDEYNIQLKMDVDDAKLLAILSKHNWRGNIRELKNFCSKLVLNCDDTALSSAFISQILLKRSRVGGISESESDEWNRIIKIGKFKDSVSEYEKKYLKYHLMQNEG